MNLSPETPNHEKYLTSIEMHESLAKRIRRQRYFRVRRSFGGIRVHVN